MDTTVALVQAYLHVNRFFTVTESPVLEAYRSGDARTVTDLDIMAVRFAGAGHRVIGSRRRADAPCGGVRSSVPARTAGRATTRTNARERFQRVGPAREVGRWHARASPLVTRHAREDHTW